jgi:UDP-3-O-[3-hydroxymyristoyl] N-acetylglucosamine deacetylase
MPTYVECQRTIASEIRLEGIGLHTGRCAAVRILPGLAGSGIVFARSDLREDRLVPARPHTVRSTSYGTALGNSRGNEVATVEHLLAALHGCGIDNAWIEVNGPEIPILDGSAAPIVERIMRAGTIAQRLPRAYMRITRRMIVEDGDSFAIIEPNHGTLYSVHIHFPSPAIGRQAHTFALGEQDFAQSIAPARTFVMLEDIGRLRERGLALGGALDNAVVVGSSGVLNRGGLRFPDEFARHKLLDLVGDLALAGCRILGKVHVVRPGHRINCRIVRELEQNPGLWEFDFVQTDSSDQTRGCPMPKSDCRHPITPRSSKADSRRRV